MYTIILIRDFPEFQLGWRGLYLIDPCFTETEAVEKLKKEIDLRGKKYGGIVCLNSTAILSVNCNGEVV